MHGFSDLLLTLYAQSQEVPIDAFPDAALGTVRAFLRFDSARWGRGTLTHAGVVRHRIHLHLENPEAIGAYEEVKGQDAPAIELMRSPPGFRVRNFNARTTFQGNERSGMREYAIRYAHENTLLGSQMGGPDGLLNFVSLYRAAEGDGYTRQEGDFLQALLPHMMEAMRMNWVASLERTLAVMPSSGFLRGIADSHGVICHLEPGLAALLEAEWPGCGVQRLPPQLQSCLLTEGRFRGRRVVADATLLSGLAFLRVRAVCPVDELSPRERSVAREIVRGRNYKEIGKFLEISPATTRNHIRAIYQKLDVKNIAQLIAAFSRTE
jgi:DNA-binding CsgD family transcriptional regulator